MNLFQLFENALYERRTGEVEHTTEHRHLYHLTNNAGIGIAVEMDKLVALRQYYISTTYRPTTVGIMGRFQYDYKLILNGKKLAETYGVFPYDHHVTQIGDGQMGKKVSANEDEIGVDTRVIEPLSEYLEGVVILSTPYTENQVLFLADINKVEKDIHVETTETIHAVSALNQLNKKGVPLYWQVGGKFEALTAKDHAYLHDIETMMQDIEHSKSRSQRHLDILERLLDKYDIKSNDIGTPISLDRKVIFRRRLVPAMMRELNGYFSNRSIHKVDSKILKRMLDHFLKMMKFSTEDRMKILAAAKAHKFFHPVVEPVMWTGLLRDLVNGDIDNALAAIEHATPSADKIEYFDSGDWSYSHSKTGMAGDQDD